MKKLGDDLPLSLTALLLFFTTAFFLTLKGTATSALFLVFFICAFQIVKFPRYFFSNRGHQFWLIALCLLSPFLAELFAQIGRGNFIGSSLDGPSRAILATGVFIYLSKKDCSKLLSVLSIGSAVGILMVFLYLQVFPEHYWGARAATHFVDPITLPCYTVALLGLVLFGDFINMRIRDANFIKLLMSVLTIYIAIESQSRSAWVAWIVLVESYLLYGLTGSFRKKLVFQLVLISSIFAAFYFSDIFRDRTVEAFGGLISFLTEGGGQETSTGQRLVMLLVDLELVQMHPFFGVPDGIMPVFAELKSLAPSLTHEIYTIKTLAGSHSELSGQIVRKGIFLGLFSLWGLFFYPAYLFFWKYKNWIFSQKRVECIGVGLIISVFVSAFFIQVFNLKMTISFYSLVMACILAHLHRQFELRETQV